MASMTTNLKRSAPVDTDEKLSSSAAKSSKRVALPVAMVPCDICGDIVSFSLYNEHSAAHGGVRSFFSFVFPPSLAACSSTVCFVVFGGRFHANCVVNK